jgi:hypothetical protein
MKLKHDLSGFFLTALITFSINVHAQDVPLKLMFTPDIIIENAKAGKFLPINIMEKPITFKQLKSFIHKASINNNGGIYIGVVVNNFKHKDKGGKQTTAHIRNIHNHLLSLTHGESKNSKSGFAEQYGARIALILPISYNPTDRYSYVQKAADGTQKLLQHPLKINDILIAVNDHPFPQQNDGFFLNTADKLESALNKFFHKGLHLISRAEHRKKLAKELAIIDSKIEMLNKKTVVLDKEIIVLDEVIDALK